MSNWDLFSSHGLVLIFFARNPRARLRDAAAAIGITERAVQNNIRDLSASGHLIIEKVGRCNRYKVMGRKHLPHPTTRSVPLRQLLRLFKTSQAEEVTTDPTAKIVATKSSVSEKKPIKTKSTASTPPKQAAQTEPVKEKKAAVVKKKPVKPTEPEQKKAPDDPTLPQQDLLF